MENEALKLLLLSIAGFVLVVVVGGQFVSGANRLLQGAALIVVAVVIFFVGRGIGVLLKADSSAG